jgi:hypothetical protein
MRAKVEGLQPGVATSLTAFLTWKAFLITAKSVGVGAERDKCVKAVAEAIRVDAACQLAAAGFASALELLAEQSPIAIAEWLASDDDEAVARDGKVDRFQRAMRKLTPRKKAEPLPLGERFTVAEYAYSFRNAVIAHGNVHSTGNLFQYLVPKFEELVLSVACVWYADRIGITSAEARHECTAR